MQFVNELFKNVEPQDYINIREIGENNHVRQLFFHFENFLNYVPPENMNVYFGTFSRNCRDGTAKACRNTGAVWCDYDNFRAGLTIPEKVADVKERLKAAKLPDASILVSSGNGIHAYYLLNQRAENDVVTINRAIATATGGDMKATDKARIMRLPNTNNVKDKLNPLTCYVVQADYSIRYDLSDFENALGQSIKTDSNARTQANESAGNSLIDELRPDRPCIASILAGVPQGERNFALGRLTKWLQLKGTTKQNTKNIIIKWNRSNDPPEDEKTLRDDFDQYWEGSYKLLGCIQDNPQLQQLLSKYCNKAECNFKMIIGNIKLDNALSYNNRLLNDLHNMTGNDLVIYGLLVRHREGLTTSLLIEKMTRRGEPCMSKPTRIKSLETLRKKGFIEITKGIQKRGIENLYKAIPQGTYGLGYTLVSNGAINGAISQDIKPSQLRLYVLLLKYAFNKGSCYPSLNTMAEKLRNDPGNMSKLLKGLEKVDYIKIERVCINGVECLDIRLLM